MLPLISAVAVAELVAGVMTGSLAIVADLAHVLTDMIGITLALVAIRMSQRPPSPNRTFGYHRSEVLVSLLNALALMGVSIWLFVESSSRIRAGSEVDGAIMVVVGSVATVLNLAAFWVLSRSSRASFNVEDAFRNVTIALLGSVGVTVAGILIVTLQWSIADPIVGIGLGVLLLVSGWQLAQKVFSVVIEGTPSDIDIYRLCSRIESLDGVTLVHDVHVWTISSRYRALTAHVLVDPSFQGDVDDLQLLIRHIAVHEFDLRHITLQIERSLEGCEEDHHVGHLAAHSLEDD